MSDAPVSPIPPGTRSTLHGIDVVAVSYSSAGCQKCAFKNQHDDDDNKLCRSVPCGGIAWLTVPDYTTHRLKS